MNMTVHGLDCDILQGNTFYEDHHRLAGKCDFVMANPPFNVDGVDKSRDGVKTIPAYHLDCQRMTTLTIYGFNISMVT